MSTRARFEALAFFVILAWMVVSPARFHLGDRLDLPSVWWAKGWPMMHGVGRKICDVEFFEVDGNGARTRIDRRVRLDVPEDVWEARGARVELADLGAHIRRMCEATQPQIDLRVAARCAKRDGWRTIHDGTANICTFKGFAQRGRGGP